MAVNTKFTDKKALRIHPKLLSKIKAKLKGKLKDKFTSVDIPKLLVRLLLSWIMISAFYVANSENIFTSPLFFGEIKLSVFIISVIVLWVVLCKIADQKFINILMILSALVYGVLGAIGYTDFSFSVGCCAAVAMIVFFTDISSVKLRLHWSVTWITAGVLIGGFTFFVGVICCLYYKNHWTSCFDFGLFSQMFYYMKETGQPLITCERDGLLSHFAVHFSPIYYLLLPIYMLIPDPRTLLVMQALIVVSGVIPLMLICKNHKLTEPACFAFAVIYTLYPCFAGGCFTYIHENNFLAPLVLWFMYFCEKGKTIPKIIFAILLLLVKEDAAVYVAVISMYFLFTDKNYKSNLFILILSVIYFVTITHFLAKYGDGVMTGRYNNYIFDNSNSLVSMIWSVLKNPVYVLNQSFTDEKLIFILQMLLPLGFMPFITKNPKRFILIIPFLLINLMTNYQWQYNIGFQYGFGSGALLIYLAVVNYSELKNAKLLLCSLCCSVIIFFGLYYHRSDYFKSYDEATEQREIIDEALSLIPDNASVISSTFFLPNLSQRDEIYELERTKQTAEYYVLDLRYQTEEYSVEDYTGDGFEIVYYEEGVVGVFSKE